MAVVGGSGAGFSCFANLLCSPTEPVLLCTVPPLKGQRKKQKNELAVQSGLIKQIPECQPHLPGGQTRHSLQSVTCMEISKSVQKTSEI